MLFTKEHYELMAQFERDFKKVGYGRLDKEPKESWAKGIFYQDGNVNQMFKMYQMGYMCGKSVALQEA